VNRLFVDFAEVVRGDVMMSLIEAAGTALSVSAESPARITDVAEESKLFTVSAFPKRGRLVLRMVLAIYAPKELFYSTICAESNSLIF